MPKAYTKHKVNVIKPKPYCPYCNVRDNFLGSRVFPKMTFWNGSKRRCSTCGRIHKFDKCTLRKPCNICKNVIWPFSMMSMQTNQPQWCLHPLPQSSSTWKNLIAPIRSLKVVKVCLHNGEMTLATHAVLDDGANRSILLPQAVQCLGLTTKPETTSLCTDRQCD